MRIIDRYRRRTDAIQFFAFPPGLGLEANDTVVLLIRDPVPAIRVLRWRPALAVDEEDVVHRFRRQPLGGCGSRARCKPSVL